MQKPNTERHTIERIVRANSGHVPVPISVVEKPGAEAAEVADGAALWTKPRSEIKPEEYTDFYRNFGYPFADQTNGGSIQGMIEAGCNIYFVLKIGAVTGIGLYKMGAQMRGESYEQFLATRNIRGAV